MFERILLDKKLKADYRELPIELYPNAGQLNVWKSWTKYLNKEQQKITRSEMLTK